MKKMQMTQRDGDEPPAGKQRNPNAKGVQPPEKKKMDLG
jgi:hypothetical protein